MAPEWQFFLLIAVPPVLFLAVQAVFEWRLRVALRRQDRQEVHTSWRGTP